MPHILTLDFGVVVHGNHILGIMVHFNSREMILTIFSGIL
nr:MAG TPA: hypothetical protein [Bacteriophage sp.]